MIETRHMVQESGHAEDSFCHNVYSDPDSGFCCLVEVSNSGKLELMEAADTEVGRVVADIGQWRCTDKGTMAQNS